jgi:sporulation integral membrane protein YtvI
LGVLTGLGAIFINQISTLSEKLPAYTENLQLQIVDTARYLQMKIGALPQDITSRAMEFATSLTEKGEQIAQWFLNSLLALLTSFSSFIVNLLIGVILAYFLSIEIDMWNQMAREKVPKTFKTAFAFLKENVIKGLLTYIKAQLKLISITFAIIYAALLLLGVSNAFAVALLAGIFDLLPLLGVSTLFIPWIIYLIFTGNISLAVWLSILLAAVVVARQLLEPKITGDSLGVSAFTMLSFMIISLSLFGVTGLILSPILIILIKSLYEQGYLQKWIRRPEDY